MYIFRVIKDRRWKGGPPLEQLFFVNHAGDELPKLQNYKNSLLWKVGQATGIKKFSLTCLRRGLEGKIQSSSELKQFSKDYNAHSSQLGATVYDKLSSARRTLLINTINNYEGSGSSVPNLSEDVEQAAKRARLEETEQQKLIQKANKYLELLKEKQVKDLTPSIIKETEVHQLRSLFLDIPAGKS